jgi:1-acyl-sn-glycerol-3-phosphate acyltransferase
MKQMPPRDLAVWQDMVFPPLHALVERGYFSFHVEGAQRVPRDEPLVYAANHSGWWFLDVWFSAMATLETLGPEMMPRYAVIDQLLASPGLGRWVTLSGGFPASWLRDITTLPPDFGHLQIYPEGAEGNCKPFWQAYQLARWRTGFVRFALSRSATIVPVALLGGEESLPVAQRLRLPSWAGGLVFPLPLTPIPLPAHWKVVFLEPLRLSHPPEAAQDYQLCRGIAADLQRQVQEALEAQTADRRLARFARWVHAW